MQKRAANGHAFGVRVDGAAPRGFLRFVSLTAFQAEGCGGALRAQIIKRGAAGAAGCVEGLCRERFLGLTGPMGRRVLKFDGPLARGLWYRPQGDEFYKPPAAVTSTSSIIIILTLVHPFATSWPSSPKGDARTLRDWLSVSYVTQYPVPPIFSFPLEVARELDS